jgi:hypothetical protein
MVEEHKFNYCILEESKMVRQRVFPLVIEDMPVFDESFLMACFMNQLSRVNINPRGTTCGICQQIKTDVHLLGYKFNSRTHEHNIYFANVCHYKTVCHLRAKQLMDEVAGVGRQVYKSISCAACDNDNVRLSRPLKSCGKCKAVHYCSVECQTANWPNHKALCKTLRKSTFN